MWYFSKQTNKKEQMREKQLLGRFEETQTKEFQELLIKSLAEKHSIQEDKIKENLKEILQNINKQKQLPLELLKIENISNLEAIVKYLREQEKLCYKEIALLLKRNPKTLAISYMKAKNKQIDFSKINTKNTIPYDAFTEELSILEAITCYLHEEGYKQKMIAEMIGKDPRTIWTIMQRVKQKIRTNEEHN